jgi:hypothetical protein
MQKKVLPLLILSFICCIYAMNDDFATNQIHTNYNINFFLENGIFSKENSSHVVFNESNIIFPENNPESQDDQQGKRI